MMANNGAWPRPAAQGEMIWTARKSTAAAPQWEPRKPLAGTRKAPPRTGDSSGAKVGSELKRRLVHCGTTYKFGPFRSVKQANSAQERPQREAGAMRCGNRVWPDVGPPTSFDPSDQSRKRILWPGWRLPGAFTLPRVNGNFAAPRSCGLPSRPGKLAFWLTPANQGSNDGSRAGDGWRAPVP